VWEDQRKGVRKKGQGKSLTISKRIGLCARNAVIVSKSQENEKDYAKGMLSREQLKKDNGGRVKHLGTRA